MMKIILNLILFFAFAPSTFAQCLSGDCKNGKGKFDFGWCVYEGEFKNEKPDGNGRMKYDDYTYTGTFKNGVEDGRGIISYTNGKSENVMYTNGKKVDYKPIALKDGEYKDLKGYDANCKSGDCNNGFGTYIFPSGNKYVGNFINQKREGKGSFYFSNGDTFVGTFKNDEKSEGIYTYSTGAKYQGTYTSSGVEYNGMLAAAVGINIPFTNGKAIVPTQPISGSNTLTSTNQTTKQASKSLAKVCPFCSGAGKKTSPSYYDHASSNDRAHGIHVGKYHTAETTPCSFCKGKGVVTIN